MNVENKKIIIVGLHGRPSIKKVFSMMEDSSVEVHVRRRVPKTGKELMRIYRNNNPNTYDKVLVTDMHYVGCTIIRWGNCVVLNTTDCKIYNHSDAIAKASSKGRTRVLLQEAGVDVPTIVNDGVSTVFPVIARPQTHAKGKNIVVLKSQSELTEFYRSHRDWYYAEFFAKDREVRVHVAFGKILCVMEKPAPADKSMVAWNKAQVHLEWNAIRWSEYPKNACLQALNAVKALGMDTGGVDVMIKGDVAKVLEVNTAPTLLSTEYTAKRYAMFFDWLFRKPNRKHWDYSTFKKAESYAWKNGQLKDEEGNNVE